MKNNGDGNKEWKAEQDLIDKDKNERRRRQGEK